jgi:hypothetical protein
MPVPDVRTTSARRGAGAEAFDALMGQRVAGGNPRLPLLASAS